VIFFFAAGLALLVAWRWRQLVVFGAALLPGVLLVVLWKQRGLGTQPLFAAGGSDLAAIGLPLPGGTLAAIGRYVNINWDHLRLNRDQLREFFWAIRPLQWVLIAGVLAIGRRSWPKAALVAAWLGSFLIVKGTSDQASVEDASFFRLLMPSFPAFVFLLASVPLLVPKLGAAVAARFPPVTVRHPRRLNRLIAACAIVFVLVPIVVLAATRVQVGPTTVKNDEEHTSIPVSGRLKLSAQQTGSGAVRLSWTAPYRGSVHVFYAILRARPAYPDPSNPEERTVVEGVACRPRPSHAAQDCHLYMPRIAATRTTSFVDRPPPGRWSYRVALAANWQDSPSGGDLLVVSRPATVALG